MKHFIDISYTGPVQTLTKTVKPLGVETFILLRIPKCNQVTVRLSGSLESLQTFLEVHFADERIRAMHYPAIKPVKDPAVHQKNRALASYKNLHAFVKI